MHWVPAFLPLLWWSTVSVEYLLDFWKFVFNSAHSQTERERRRVNWTAVAAEWWEISQKWKALRSCVIDTNYLNAERFTIRQNRWNEVKHPDNCLYRHVKAFLSHFKTVFIALARSPSLFHSAVISFSAVLFSICFINNLLHSVLDLKDDMLV